MLQLYRGQNYFKLFLPPKHINGHISEGALVYTSQLMLPFHFSQISWKIKVKCIFIPSKRKCDKKIFCFIETGKTGKT